jgi:hypothetical protein
MKKERKHYTGAEKVAILRRHLLDKVPVSDLCDELGLQPTVFSASFGGIQGCGANLVFQEALSGTNSSLPRNWLQVLANDVEIPFLFATFCHRANSNRTAQRVTSVSWPETSL